MTAYAYDPSGRVGRGDLEIMATDRRALVNTSIILHPKVTYAEQQELGSRPATDRCRRTRSWSRRTTSATTCPRSCVTWSSGTAGTPTPTAPENTKNAFVVNAEFWADHDEELTERFNTWLAQ